MLAAETKKWISKINAAPEPSRLTPLRCHYSPDKDWPAKSWFVVLSDLDAYRPPELQLRFSAFSFHPDAGWQSTSSKWSQPAALAWLMKLDEPERTLAGEMLSRTLSEWNHSADSAATCTLPDGESWYELIPWLLDRGRLYLDWEYWGLPGYMRLKRGASFAPTPEWYFEVDTRDTFIQAGVYRHTISVPGGNMHDYIDVVSGVVGALPDGWSSALLVHLVNLLSIAPGERRAFAAAWQSSPYANLFPPPPVESDPVLQVRRGKLVAGKSVDQRPVVSNEERIRLHEASYAAAMELLHASLE
jgi:hypothetical protein